MARGRRRTPVSRPALALSSDGDRATASRLERVLAHEGRIDRVTHGFHTYPAGLHPDAAADLVAMAPAGPVLDPFCGGGTVLVEARLAGRASVGRDVSPVARLVSATRVAWTDEALRTTMRSTARKLAATAHEAQDEPPARILDAVGDWYEPHVRWELESLRRGIAAAPPEARSLLWAGLSSILVKASHRRSDTSARRAEQHRPPGTTAVLFHKRVRELGRRLEALEAALGPDPAPCDVVDGDARTTPPGGGFALVATSPPYPGTYDYLSMQALREAWLGVRGPRALEIGPRRDWRGDAGGARAAWFDATVAWMGAAAAALRPGGWMAIVIGDGHDDLGLIDTLQASWDAGRSVGLVPHAHATAERQDVGRGVVLGEHAIVLTKA